MISQTIIIHFHFIIYTTFYSILATSAPSNYLPRGSSLSVEDPSSNYLISTDKTFTCGFYTSNQSSNAYYFSIWFTNSKARTLVWMANRENPVNGRGSSLTLRKDGAMVLTDLDGSNLWQTNTSTKLVEKAELLNSGNLVLKDPKGKILWQSFHYPTDTLLPNQIFTKKTNLISRVSEQVFDAGYFTLSFDDNNVLSMVYDGPEISSIYWPSPDFDIYQNGRFNYNSSRIASFDELGNFVSSDRLQFSASDVGYGVIRRLTMDYDGNLRLYSMNNVSGLWSISWQGISQQCSVHGLCGRNGICIYTPEPKCSCPPYYEPLSPTDWTKGCKPKFERACTLSNNTYFLEMPHVDYWGFDLNTTHNITFKDCRELCLGDCRCQAFKHVIRQNLWTCYIKGALFNGYRGPESLYMRIPVRPFLTSEPKVVLTESHLGCPNEDPIIKLLPDTYSDGSSRSFKWVYMYSFGGAIGAIEAIFFAASWFFFFRKHRISASLEDGYRTISTQFRSFSYSELKRATCKFEEVLGKGGFGAVYKGVLADSRQIAVKKLEKIVQGEEEFWAEVSTFGRINHMNLARMWGFCCEGKYRLLVYEYIENGSLDKHLFSSCDETVLEWETRFKIALGTAKGLAYLHHECLEWVIHCDIKPENILLDSDFEPKISDFGLAKLCKQGGQSVPELSAIRGTKGYIAPEWTTNLPLTAKVDVYSYGVVLLELVRGTRLSSYKEDDSLGEGQVMEFSSFVRLVKERMQDGDESWLEDFVDSRLDGKFKRNQAVKMIVVGLSCVEDDRNKRPTMESVVQALAECEDETAVIHIPANI